MMRLLELGMVCGIGWGAIGLCASEASAELSQSPSSFAPHCQQAKTHDVETYRRAVERDSHDIDALQQLGYEQLKGQQVESAIATFQQALDLASHDIEKIEVYRGLGEAYLIANELDLAQEAFLNGLRLEVPSPNETIRQEQVAFRMAVHHYHQCDWEAAIASFRAAYRVLESMAGLSPRYSTPCPAALKQSIQTRPSAEAYECLGDVVFNMKQYDAALVAYQQAYDLGNAEMLEHLSDSYGALQQYDQAVETLQAFITISEESGDDMRFATFRKLARLYLKQQQWALAQEAYERSAVFANRYDERAIATAKGQIAYGLGLIEANEYERAIAACESAVPGLPQSPKPLLCLGEAYYYQGDLNQALQYVEQAQQLIAAESAPENIPRSNNVHSFIVSSFYQQGTLQDYIQEDQRSITLFQYYWPSMASRARLNEILGGILLAQQQYDQAALTFKTALYEYPLSTRASLGLAKSLIAQGKEGGAIAVLNRYLQIDPENVEAQELLQGTSLAD